MSIQEEKLAVLKMIEDGKITAQEGLELMEALKHSTTTPSFSKEPAQPSSMKMLRIRVREGQDKTKVNVNIPLPLVKVGLDIAKNVKIGEHQDLLSKIDMDEIIALIETGAQGKLVEIEDVESDTMVEVFVD